jgi:hypothetical protein
MTPTLQALTNALAPLAASHNAPLVAAVLTGSFTFVFALGIVAVVAKRRAQVAIDACRQARLRRSTPPVMEIRAAYHHTQPVVQWLPWSAPVPEMLTPAPVTEILVAPAVAQIPAAPHTEVYFTPPPSKAPSAVETGPMTPAFTAPLATLDFDDDPTLFGEPVFERNELDATPARHATAPKIRRKGSASSSVIRIASCAA